MKHLPKQHFVYSFQLGDAVPNFYVYPETTRVAAECFVAKVIYESFVVSGDQDYLMARLLALKGLPRGFYWAAAQMVEKYLKALLLMRGNSVASYRDHPLLKLFKAAALIEPTLTIIDISRHQSITAPDYCTTLLKQFTVSELLQDLETHGAPDNRYNALGVDYNTGHLFALDSFAYRIRGLIGVPPINESHANLSEDLVKSFSIANPWFCFPHDASLSLPAKELPLKAHGTVTTLEFMLKQREWLECDIALKWLSKNMQLPKSMKKK
jgi:hypothetical protein